MNRILYLHGFASAPSSSKALYFQRLLHSAGAQVDVPDLAAGDFENLTITGQLRVIDDLAGNDSVSLIGSSMGGYLAALWAVRHPEQAKKLVLLAPAFGFAHRWPESLGTHVVEEWRRTGFRQVYHYGDNRTRRLSYQLLADGQQYEGFPDFRQPALIFHGSLDDVVPASFSEEFAATHPNATLEVLASGHDLHNVLDYMAPKVSHFLAA